jgi:hypothetical protein
MKLIVAIFSIFIYSTLFAQIDSSGNYAQIDFPNLLYRIDITKNKKNQFSDSIYRFPNFQTIPSSIFPIYNSPSKKNFHFSNSINRQTTLNVLQVGQSETFLFYQIGSANSQNLFLTHLQRINKKLSGLVEYSRNKSDGFYIHQEGKSEKLNVLFNFNSFSNNYNLQPYFQYQNFTRQENGGIKNDSLFSIGDFTNPTFLETNLVSAKNTSDHIQVGIKQKFFLKSKTPRIYNDIGFSIEKRIFNYNPSELYYNSIYLDTSITNDLYKTERFYNEIALLFLLKKTIHKIGLKNEFLKYSQNIYDTTSFENKVFLNSQLNFLKSKLLFDFEYSITGFNSGNFSSQLYYEKINQSLFSKIKYQANILSQNPEIIYFRMKGNHFQWNNNLTQVFYFENNFTVESKFGELKFNYEIIKNFVFLNENIQVVQTNESIQKIKINYFYILDKKKIYWRNDLIYQNVFSGNQFYRLPNFTIRSDLKFKSQLKAMDLQIGITANYITSFYANAYDPALGTFYLQNEIKTGNYPILDFYIQSSIKTVDLKFTLAHFNSGFTGYNYYATPLYPIAPRAFYFGLSWHFKD